MLTHGKCSNKITVQRDDGAALSLCIVLFFQRSAIKLYTNKISKGCIRSEGQFLFLALRDRCTIPGCDFRGQLCRHGGSLGDFLGCRSIGEILVTVTAVPILNVAFFGNGGGLCVNVFQVGVVVLVRAAVACLANLTDRILGAGRFTAGVRRLMKHHAAGADLPVLRVVVFPVAALVVMGVALSLEHGQGLVRRIQILTFVCPRVSIVVVFASLEQLPHRAVGKFCGGLGVGSLDINTVRSAGWVSCRQIVAVIDSGASRAGQIAYNFARIGASVQTADIITVGNQNIYVATIRMTCDSTGVFAGDHSDIIAVTNCCVYSSSVDLSNDYSADSTGAEGA